MNLIGLDIGTTTICGVLYSRKEGKTLKTLVRENSFIKSSRGEYLQDPDVILQKIKLILDQLIDFSTENIDGISLSAQMHGILYVDKDGQALSPFFTWQNQRGLALEGHETLEKILTERLGYPVYTGYGIVTHYSLTREGSLPQSTAVFCNIGDYVCMHLSGRKTPVTDITLGTSMGIGDARTGKCADSLSLLGRNINDAVPEIVSSTKVLGEYRKIPVIQPLGDNQASFLGSVKNKEKSLLLNYGTAGQISFYRKKYRSFPGFETRPLGNEGFLYAAFSLCGGNSYKILSRFFEESLSVFAPGTAANCMKSMDEMILDFSNEEVECMPLFLGQRGGGTEKGYFRNLTEGNFTPQNLVKALVQGMVNELYQHYAVLPEEVKNDIFTLIGAGNGIRKNRHLIKAVEAKYGLPVTLLDLSEESCLGAVINAGKGVGIYADYGEGASDIVRDHKEV